VVVEVKVKVKVEVLIVFVDDSFGSLKKILPLIGALARFFGLDPRVGSS
jgi:hypothetical protein